ncbi:hypothetical protein [Natronorubrum sp. DTA7]|uniref:hypothetical protein n=1 Tax=Natronorubrum sp. DTA7 TaxID=3447016 RepID=UPI003F872992
MIALLTNAIDEVDLEHELVQRLALEAVRAGLETPLREPILEAIDETTAEPLYERRDDDSTADDESAVDAVSDTGSKSRLRMAAQGLIVFAVLFVVLYVAFRVLLGADAAGE